MAEGDHKSNVNIDAGLSAKFEAKTEIPKEATGRLLDALTDVLRPFSESRGLRADQIRLQREDVLIQIARKAQERLAMDHSALNPVSNKFMVPFLEKASAEEPEGILIDWWARLLAEESYSTSNLNIMALDVLSKIGSTEAKALQKVCDRFWEGVPKLNSNFNRDTLYHRCRLNHESVYSRLGIWFGEFLADFEKEIEGISFDERSNVNFALSLPELIDDSDPWVVLEIHVFGRNATILPEARKADFDVWDTLRLLELMKIEEVGGSVTFKASKEEMVVNYTACAYVPTALGFYVCEICGKNNEK